MSNDPVASFIREPFVGAKLDSHNDVWADFYQLLGGTLAAVGLRR